MGRKRTQTDAVTDTLPAQMGVGVGAPGMPFPLPMVRGVGQPMPAMPAMPSMPAMPGVPGFAGARTVMPCMPAEAAGSDSIHKLRYQQMAAAYEQAKHAGIAPEVAELSEYHGLDDRATRALDEEMKKRRDTFDADMEALWVGLEGARNVSGLLMMKLKDMRMGTFRGMSALDRTVQAFAKAHRLDAQAAVKLGEVLDKRDDPEGDMTKIGHHLARSNKPSSLMMMMLRDLREGLPIKEPVHSAAVGSKEHEKELKTRLSRSRSGGRSRGHDRDRNQDRDRGRDRDRERRSRGRSHERSRRRSRTRSRSRKRSRSRDRR